MTQWVLFWGLKWPKGDADQSFATTTKYENAKTLLLLPHIPSWHGVLLPQVSTFKQIK
jgi:hypothetical protein